MSAEVIIGWLVTATSAFMSGPLVWFLTQRSAKKKSKSGAGFREANSSEGANQNYIRNINTGIQTIDINNSRRVSKTRNVVKNIEYNIQESSKNRNDANRGNSQDTDWIIGVVLISILLVISLFSQLLYSISFGLLLGVVFGLAISILRAIRLHLNEWRIYSAMLRIFITIITWFNAWYLARSTVWNGLDFESTKVSDPLSLEGIGARSLDQLKFIFDHWGIQGLAFIIFISAGLAIVTYGLISSSVLLLRMNSFMSFYFGKNKSNSGTILKSARKFLNNRPLPELLWAVAGCLFALLLASGQIPEYLVRTPEYLSYIIEYLFKNEN